MRYVLWLLWFLYTRATWIKDGSDSTCIGQTLLHETQSTVIHSLEIFIKKLQGKCMDNYCLCLSTKFTPFIGLEGDGNELLLWPCHSPEGSSFKLEAGLILPCWIAFQQCCQGNFILFFFSESTTSNFLKKNQTPHKGTRWKIANIYLYHAPSNHIVIINY